MKNLILICVAVLALCVTGCPNNNDSGINERSHSNRFDHSDRFLKQELLREHNWQRRGHRLDELYYDRDLADAAQKWAEHMCDRGRLYHGSLRSKVNMNQWDALGENIAWGQNSAEEVVASWMDSRGHRRNILSDDFYHVGFGVARDSNGRIYWCAIFGGAKTEVDHRRPW